MRLALAFVLWATSAFAVALNDQGGGKVWDYYDLVQTDGPCHYYRFDAASGTTETDVGRNAGQAPCNGALNGGYAGTFTLKAKGSAKGDADYAASFGGASGDRWDANSNSDYAMDPTNTNGWAVEFWEKTSGTTGYFVTNYTSSAAYNWYLYNNSGALLNALKNTGSSCQTTMSTSTGGSGINDGNWHHIALLVIGNGSGAFSTFDGYVDGVNVWTKPTFSGTFCNGNYNLGVAQLNNTGNLAMTIDELAFYRKTGGSALTAAQVTNHYLMGLKSPHHGPAHVTENDWFLPGDFHTHVNIREMLAKGIL